jgi:hypothetical protein
VQDALLIRRLSQPARHHGGGLRRRATLSRTAFAACVAEVVPQLIDVATRDGVRRGFFPSLESELGTGSFGTGGSWLTTFVAAGDADPEHRRTASEFSRAWRQLMADVRDGDVSGPLDQPAEQAGRGIERQLQRQMQLQYDQVARDVLHADMMALPGDDQRRVAYLECGPLSTSWIGSWPSDRWLLSPRHFREAFALYYGLASPIVVECGLTGTVFRDTRGRPHVCDRYGTTLARAQMSDGGGHMLQSRSMERVIVQSVLGAGIAGRPQPDTIFSAVLPQRVRDDERVMRGIVADALFTVPRLFGSTRAARRRERRHHALIDQLFDIKCLHDGTAEYDQAARGAGAMGYMRQGGVARRAASVPREYLVHAMHLDAEHHGTVLARGARGMLHPVGGPGPVQRTLATYPPVRGLAFGPRADASEDVHTLLGITAHAEAERGWRLMGSRSQSEALSYLTTSLRRDWGIAALRCEAALRCRRAELLAGRAFGRRAQEMEEFDHARAAGEDFMRGVHARAGPAHRG